MRLLHGGRFWREWLLLCVAIVAAVAVAQREQVAWRLDLALYDVALSLWQRDAPADVVIVAIDEASLAAHGRWPWPRSLQARLLEQVGASQPRAVGMDLLLTEPSREPEEDQRFAAAIARLPGGVLGIFREAAGGSYRFVAPQPEFAAAARRLGHVHVEVDLDAVVRSVYLLEGAEAPDTPHFALALASAGAAPPRALPGEQRPPGARTPGHWQRDHWFRIPFSGPPGHIARISAAEVIAGIDLGRLSGKQVLVGATAAGLGDAYAVPTSGAGRLMPGVEISAQTLAALATDIDIRSVSGMTALAIAVFAVMLTLCSYLFLQPRGALVGTFLVALGLLAFSLLAPRLWHLWFPPASALLAVMLCYPLWSWRRLDASLAFMRAELQALQAEPDLLPMHTVERQSRSPGLVDVVERSIDAVRAAHEKTRVMRRFVVDSVALQADGVLVIDAQGRVALCNARAVALLDAEGELRGAPARRAFERLAHVDDALWQMLEVQAGTVPLQQSEARNAEGKELLVTTTACEGGSAGMIGYIVNITDVSALKAASRAREEAMAFLSHDLRAPQAAILSVLELRRAEPPTVSEDQLLEQIERSVRRTLALAEAFVTLTRADHLDPTRFALVDLLDVCREMSDEAWPLARSKDVRIVLRLEHEEALVAGERALLAAAVLNLLDNAVKHSPAGAAVLLGIDRIENNWAVSVQDHGPGIAADELPNLFMRFRPLARQTRHSGHGNGLGLVIVDTVARKHSGRVEVRSAVGEGSSFVLIVPAVVDVQAPGTMA